MSMVPRCMVLSWEELPILNASKHIKYKDILQSSHVKIKHTRTHFQTWKSLPSSSMYLSFPLKGQHLQMSLPFADVSASNWFKLAKSQGKWCSCINVSLLLET